VRAADDRGIAVEAIDAENRRVMATIRFDLVFTGRVQGVGFRATTRMLAEHFAIRGWVKNQPDGSVRAVAEGEEPELERFLRALQSEMSGFIRETKIERGAATNEHGGFEITL
jgi:acylphosphatase